MLEIQTSAFYKEAKRNHLILLCSTSVQPNLDCIVRDYLNTALPEEGFYWRRSSTYTRPHERHGKVVLLYELLPNPAVAFINAGGSTMNVVRGGDLVIFCSMVFRLFAPNFRSWATSFIIIITPRQKQHVDKELN